MANRCKDPILSSAIVENMDEFTLDNTLDNCEKKCPHYAYCQKVADMNDRLKEIQEAENTPEYHQIKKLFLQYFDVNHLCLDILNCLEDENKTRAYWVMRHKFATEYSKEELKEIYSAGKELY